MVTEQIRPALNDERAAERIEGLIEVLGSYAVSPPNQDEYFRSFAIGVLEAYGLDANVQKMIDAAVAGRDSISSYSTKLIQDFYQFQHIDDPAYPFDHARPARWRDGFRKIAADSSESDAFVQDVSTHVLQSTVVGRYITVPLIARAYHHQIGDSPTCGDFGCGLGNGSKQLAGRWGFDPLAKLYLDSASETERLIVASEINTITSHFPNSNFESIVGIDKQVPNDQSVRRGRSSSHYPGQLAVPNTLENFDKVLLSEPEGVNFAYHNLLETGRLAEAPERGFDIGIISTWFYQLDDGERTVALNNIIQNMSNNGVLILEEYAHVPDPNKPFEVVYLDNWADPDFPFPYQAMVLNMQRYEEGFRPMLGFTNGRATKMKPSGEFLDLLKQAM